MSHPALDVVLTMLRRQLEELVALGDAVREHRPEAVHDMRTIVRRMRTTLAASHPVLDRRVTDSLRDRLGALGVALEPARDAEVRAELADSLLARTGTDDDAVRSRLVDGARSEYDRDLRALVAVLDAPAYAELLSDLNDLIGRPPAVGDAYRGQRSVLRRALIRQARRAHARLERIDDDDLDSVHDARKAVRRVRYLAEAIEQYAPHGRRDGVLELAAAGRTLQDLLGDHRDAVLHAGWIAREARRAELAGENPEAYERLERIERERAQELVGARADAIAAFERMRKAL